MQVDYRLFVNRSLPLQERGCTSKSYFVSRGEAKAVLRSGRHSFSGLQPYRCRYCDGWHLGHRRPPAFVAVRV